MSLGINHSSNILGASEKPVSLADMAIQSQVQNMESVLWTQMLTEMNKNGASEGSLGPGSSFFQSLFLQDIAKKDFQNMGGNLTTAAVAQLSGSPQLAGAPEQSVHSTGQPSASHINQAVSYARGIWPMIKSAAASLNVSPVAILAQSALETGWGSSTPGENLFGIKADLGQPSISAATTEFEKGATTATTALFREYTSKANAISGYVDTIKHSFSNALGQTSVAGFAAALQNSGYATDPAYAQKIVDIAQSPMMKAVMAAVAP